MSRSTRKTKTIAFRLTDEEYRQIEEAAAATGKTRTSGAGICHSRSRAAGVA